MTAKIIMIALFCFLSTALFGQSSDLDLLKAHCKSPEIPREVNFGISDSKNPIVRYNPISLGFGSLLFIYQKYIAQQTSSHCPYSPSCSEYSKQLIKKHGLLKGMPCAADRLMRCNKGTVEHLYWKRNPLDHHIHEKTEYYQFQEDETNKK